MKRFVRYCSLASALVVMMSAPGSSTAAAEHPTRAKPVAELHTLFTSDDYPTEALMNGEQGAVAFKLSIAADGRVTDCSISSSSGSPSLDTESCRMLRERARFEPALDASGKPTADEHRGRIAWVMPDNFPPSLSAALKLWTACVFGEAAKLSISSLPMSEITDRAFQGCAQLGNLVASEMTKAEVEGLDQSRAIAEAKEQFTTKIAPELEEVRAALKGQEKR